MDHTTLGTEHAVFLGNRAGDVHFVLEGCVAGALRQRGVHGTTHAAIQNDPVPATVHRARGVDHVVVPAALEDGQAFIRLDKLEADGDPNARLRQLACDDLLK